MQPLNHPFNFVYDTWVADKPVPNLIDPESVFENQSHLAHQWPYIIGHKLEPLCEYYQYPFHQYRLTDPYPSPSLYPVNLARIDFKIDYFSLLPPEVKNHLSQGSLLLLLFSPDPTRLLELQKLLKRQQTSHGLPDNCYRVVVNNHMAIYQLPWFYHWTDIELEFAQANHNQEPLVIHDRPRSRDFTILSRRHQPWRALALTHWQKVGLLDNSYWSYGNFRADEAMTWNPIHVDRIPNLSESDIDRFLSSAPYTCDDIPLGKQADISHVVRHHVDDSYIHVILDTAMEAQCGAHVSEKVFRAIKYGQPFVILGTYQSLHEIRRLGYRVFDSVINNDYDKQWNHHERYMSVYRSLLDIQSQGIRNVFERCLDDVEHNQKLFMESRQKRLRNLEGMLTFEYLHTENKFIRNLDCHSKRFEPDHLYFRRFERKNAS
jgi:hypothetical protein